MIGQTISHYKITEKLGEGGMGVVYKAEDTKLKRPVALKFLKAHLLGDEEIKARFWREAEAAASLNHPNICTVYEIDEVQGKTLIAMAFIEGEGLDKKIDAAPLKINQALDIATQIARGLRAAHGKQITHRDIKPANVMVGSDGHATIMDFGLALLANRSKLTKMDTTMGTVAYMSPEQAEGAGTDHRTDVWALGAVMYEMVTGQRAFQGDYDQAITYSILHEEPEPMTALRTGVPMELERITSKCLVKHRKKRYQSIADLLLDLETLREKQKSSTATILRTPVATGTHAGPADGGARHALPVVATSALAGPEERAGQAESLSPPHPLAKYRVIENLEEADDSVLYRAEDTQLNRLVDVRVVPQSSAQRIARVQRRKQAVVLGAGALGVLFGLVFAFLWLLSPAPVAEAPLRRFTIVPPEPVRTTVRVAHLAISPNGRHIAFVTDGAGGKLWIQDLDQQQPRVIEGTEGARSPFWSPDSTFIGFAAGAELKKVSVQGGLAIRLCALPSRFIYGASWSPDGELIVFSSGQPRALHEVPARGGAPSVVISPDEPETQAGSLRGRVFDPHFLPAEGGSRLLVFAFGTLAGSTLAVQDLETGRRQILGPGARPVYSPSGHLLHQSSIVEYGLWALPFSLGSLEATGEAFPIAQDSRGPTVAADGTLAYLDAASNGQQQLGWRDRRGQRTGDMGLVQEAIRYPRLSSDERLVAFSSREGAGTEVWVYDISRGTKTRLHATPRSAGFAPVAWSPTGKDVAFSSHPAGNADIFLRRADGAGDKTVLTATPRDEYVSDWSLDGKYLLYQRRDLEGGINLWYLERSEDGSGWEPHAFLETSFSERAPVLSPDGRFVAYTSNESGQEEVYVLPFPEGGSRTTVSNNGGRQACWSRDGKELFYVEGGTLMAVSVEASPEFSVGSVTRLFEHPSLAAGITIPQYDVSADGQRFLLAEPVGEDTAEPAIRVVQNWFAEFKDREQD